MTLVRTAGVAGLVLAAGALPVAAFALTSADDPHGPPAGVPGAVHATASHPAEPDETADEATEPDDTGTGEPNPASAAGRAHAEAMKAWARCVAEAAGGPKTDGKPMPPKVACGEKPVAPGRARHLAGSEAPPGHSGDHATKPHAKSGSHGR